jgi:hypothetical protein
MEITEPVILDIPQGRKTVRLEIKTRADARDLIAVIARRMLDLPDDGDGGVLVFAPDDEPVLWKCTYCKTEHEAMPSEQPPVCPECGPPDGTRRVLARDPARDAKLAALGEQVARLSQPAAVEHPFDAGEGSRELSGPGRDLLSAAIAEEDAALAAPERRGCKCGHTGTAHFLDQLAGGELTHCHVCDCVAYEYDEPEPLASVTRLVPVTRIVDGEPVEVQPCPHVHPDTQEPCVGLLCHQPPCRDVDGDEWVPAGSAVTA